VLSNIYLHELDKFIERKVIESKRTGDTSKENPEYKKVHTRISNLRQYFLPSYRYSKTLSPEQVKERLETILKLQKYRAKLKSRIPGEGYRIYYVRYADDFLIGVNGSFKRAEQLREEIKTFLKNELLLDLNMEKTKITSAEKSRAHFLGAQIRAHSSRTSDQKRRTESYTKSKRLINARITQGNIIVLAPIEKLAKKLEEQGMCSILNFKRRLIIPKRKTA
jgi:hypothetical protein